MVQLDGRSGHRKKNMNPTKMHPANARNESVSRSGSGRYIVEVSTGCTVFNETVAGVRLAYHLAFRIRARNHSLSVK
jgi:hypothetical protein